MLPEIENVLIALLGLVFLPDKRMAPTAYDRLLQFVRNFFEHNIDSFGLFPLCCPTDPNLSNRTVRAFERGQYLAARRALFTALRDDPIQWDKKLVDMELEVTSDRPPSPSVFRRLWALWDSAFFTDIHVSTFQVAQLHLIFLAQRSGLQFRDVPGAENMTNFLALPELP